MRSKTNSYLAVVLLAVLAMVASACSSGADTETANAAEPTALPTAAPTAEPEPTAIPAPTATAVPTATPEPVPTDVPEGDVMVDEAMPEGDVMVDEAMPEGDVMVDEAMPEGDVMVDQADLSAEDAVVRGLLIADLMTADFDRESAECVADEMAMRAGGYTELADMDFDDPNVTVEMLEPTMMCAFMSTVLTDVNAEALIEQGYTEAEAQCFADAVRTRFSSVMSADSIDPELDVEGERAYAEDLNRCADPVGPEAGSPAPGSDTNLDQLWDDCNASSGISCHQLFTNSPFASDYETYGSTCGGRVPAVSILASVNCGLYLDGEFADGETVSPPAGSPPPGEDPVLDAYWEQCNNGDGSACDSLFFESEVGSVYEAYGYTCGGRDFATACSEVTGG